MLMQKLLHGFLIVVGVFLVGVVGYMTIEQLNLLDAAYMTIITLSTVGYTEVHPLSSAGRIFTICFIALSMMTGAVFLAQVARFVLEGEFKGLLWRQKMLKKTETVRNHFILCGYGRVGREVCKAFDKAGIAYLIIEKDETKAQNLIREGKLVIQEDATLEETLLKAQLHSAKGLVAALDSDADNVYLCLTARSLNPKLNIVARAADDRAIKNLRQAGADKVISPTLIAGHQLAQAVLRPAVLNFIHLATYDSSLDLLIEELPVTSSSVVKGKTIASSQLKSSYHLIVVAVQKKEKMQFNPDPDYIIEEGDILIVLGPSSSIQKLLKEL